MSATDTHWRDQVCREALAAGMPATVAQAVARYVGRPSPLRDTPPAAMRVRMRAPAPRPRTTADRLARICGLFNAAGIVPDFTRAGTPLRHVAAMLTRASGTQGLSAAGAERIRLELFAAARGAA